MKRIILFLAVMFAATLSYSQGEIDALQFSRNNLMGTARAISMGGAFGALGGDITGVAINPAGIGVYRSSEIVGTLNIEDVGTEAQLPKGISTTDNKVKFNLDNIGYVGYYPSGSDNVLSYNFGFAYNRLKNYDRKYNMQGMNMPVSLSDYAAHKSYDLNEDYLKHPDLHSGVSDPFSDMPWLSVLSYNAGIIKRKPNSMPHEYESVLNPGDLVNNHLSASEKGYVASYDFTFGMNIRDILSLGFTLSVTDIKHTADFYYSEDFSRGGNFFLTNWLQTNGDGLGLKIGAIVRPMDALRIGIAYHSPTWYSMSDRYSAMMEYSVKNYIQSPTDNIFDYKFQTPYKWVFSLAGVIGTSAIVSVDYELTNYSGMKFSTSNGGFSQDFKDHNSYMKEDLKSTSVLRAGLEFRITPQVSARLGYAWAETPFKKRVLDGEQEIITAGSIPHYVLDGDAHHFSIGAGYRFTRNFYMDLAVVMKQQKDKLYAFSRIFNAPEVNSIPADLTNSVFKGLLTFGYKF